MKKLLITGLCVLGLYSIPDARASNIAALPLDNTHTTHHVLVPELPQSVSGSYQVAKVQWLPDYQNELTGKRTNDGGANRQEKTCEQYGKKSSCAPKIGKGVSHPLPGLTCYDECVDCSTYGKVAKCLSPKVGINPSSPIAGLTCYDRCDCPGQYKYTESNCIAPAELDGEECFNNDMLVSSFPSVLTSPTQARENVLYTECNCPAEYKYDNKLVGETCTSCTGSEGTKYKCTTCTGYNLIVCPTVGGCEKCPQDSTKLKLTSCDVSKGWVKSADGLRCEAMPCPMGEYSVGILCSGTQPDRVCSGYSGGQICCKCVCNNVNSSCTVANYPYTFVPANSTKTAECSTGCGSEKVTRYKIQCNNGYSLVGSFCQKLNVVNGISDIQPQKNDACPTGYQKSACSSGYKQTDKKTTDAGTTCYQCKNDTCPTGYNKTACASGYKQTDTKPTDAGTTCYKCEKIDDSCPNGYQLQKCSVCERQVDTDTTATGKPCYKCKMKTTCEDFGYQSSKGNFDNICKEVHPSCSMTELTCYTDCYAPPATGDNNKGIGGNSGGPTIPGADTGMKGFAGGTM